MTLRTAALGIIFFISLTSKNLAQVHYHHTGSPWTQRASEGPDSKVPGWFYNLGTTGIRCQLIEKNPKALLVRYVFPKSIAHNKIKEEDLIIGINGTLFQNEHQNGYGMKVFGAKGPISEIAQGIKEALTEKGKNSLTLMIKRKKNKRPIEVRLKLKKDKRFFEDNLNSNNIEANSAFDSLLDYLVDNQRKDGSWGSPPQDTFAPLALMSSTQKQHKAAVLRNVKMHAKTTHSTDKDWLINWRYMSAGIVMSEYYLKTQEKWLIPEIQEVYDFLIKSQYIDLSQIDPRSHETHPHSIPKNETDKHGGWGHNPGFEGYGPISMLTAQGALAFALMKRCGIKIDEQRHQAAYSFLRRASGDNFYVWYEDQAAGVNDWADMGRTGAAAIAFNMHPFDEEQRNLAKKYARLIGQHPESFPDTHGSPLMGMALGALGAFCDPDSFAKLMSANEWWFTLSECPDGSFYYQPNRDNAGYGSDSRITASAIVAFILSLPRKALAITGAMPVAPKTKQK